MRWYITGILLLLVCVAVNGSRPSPSTKKKGDGKLSHDHRQQRLPLRVGADQGDWIMEEPVFHNRHSSDRILYRSHRQAEDSYEDGGEYEYEEENGNGNGAAERNKEEGDAEEYYDSYDEQNGNGGGPAANGEDEDDENGNGHGENGESGLEEDNGDEDEEEEQQRTPSPTTTTSTTTTTPEPYIEDHDEGMDSEQYEEERYEAERRRYEIAANEGYFTEPPPPPPPPPSSGDADEVGHNQEENGNGEHEEEEDEEVGGEAEAEDVDEYSRPQLTTSEPPRETESEQQETEEEQYTPVPTHQVEPVEEEEEEEHERDNSIHREEHSEHEEHEEDNGYPEREHVEEEQPSPERENEIDVDPVEEDHEPSHVESQEIIESGREDLERYTSSGGSRPAAAESVEHEREEHVDERHDVSIESSHLDREGPGEREEVGEEEEGRDPYSHTPHPHEDEEQYTEPPRHHYEPEGEGDVDEAYEEETTTTTISPTYPYHHHVEEHEEIEEEEVEEHEEEAETTPEPTTTTTTTTSTTTTTTRQPDQRNRYDTDRTYDPDRYDEEEEEDDEEDEEDEDSYYRRPSPTTTTTTTTTSTTTTEPPPTQPPTRDSLEEEETDEDEDPRNNEIHGLTSFEEQDKHRYEYEHSTELPTTRQPATTTPPRRYEVDGEDEGRRYEGISAENEIDSHRYETEEDILRRYTSTTTTPPPLEPEREDDDDDDDVAGRQPSAPHLEIIDTADSSENRIYDAKSEEDEESLLHGRIDEERGGHITHLGPVHQPEPVAPPSESESGEPDDIHGRRGGHEDTTTKIECFTGYTLSQDGSECLDIDECGQGICGPTQICLNLPGSYVCSCPTGFTKDFRNPRNCRDVNECEQGNDGCNQDCVNTLGSFYCSCADDFRLGPDGKTCIRNPTTTTTTTTTTTPPPTTTTVTTTRRTSVFVPLPPVGSTDDGGAVRNCPTPPVPRGAGIAYLYCSRSPVGIHHRHSQLERRLLQDWAARKNKTLQISGGGRHPNRFRHRRNLKRRLRQTTYSPGSMCELRCRPGFQLKGQYTLHCNSSAGIWIGPRDGYCQATPKTDQNPLQTLNITESSPSNEIPRLGPNEIGSPSLPSSSVSQFRPSFVPPATSLTTGGSRFPNPTFRPHYYTPPPASRVTSTVATTTTTTTTPRSTTTLPPPPPPTTSVRPSPPLIITPPPPASWPKPQIQIPLPAVTPSTPATTNRRPYIGYNNNNYYYTPTSSIGPTYSPPATTTTVTTTTSAQPTTTSTARNSYIQLTYRFKTPWIKCPDDMRIDLPANQNLAYVIIPQPQTNVDWWRQVTSEPAWAKGLETEVGPGKQRITFRARTAAPANNTAECSFYLEVKDNEPPRVRECPESFSVRLNPGQSTKTVTWIEPSFSDNVRISAVKKSHEPGVLLPLGEHLINYEAKDNSENKARCSFTVNVLPPNGNGRRPVNTDPGSVTPSPPVSATTYPAPVHATLRNVVCHVGKKGRRIVFLSRVVPRGCSEMTVDVVGDSAGQGAVNTVNTVTQGSAENSATSQISSVSFSSHDHPQSASAFSQAVSNGRNNNRLVHSTSSVTTGNQGTSSRASSYAVAISSSSRNFDLPFIATGQDKQIYDEDFVVPPQQPPSSSSSSSHQQPMTKSRSGGGGYYPRPAPSLVVTSTTTTSTTTPAAPTVAVPRPAPTLVVGNSNNIHSNDWNGNKNSSDYRKYFRHFDSWDSNKSWH